MASFKKIKTGWQYRVSYKDGDKYRTKSGNGFKTKKEAEIAARKVEDKLNQGIDLNSNPVFTDHMQTWFETFKKGRYSKKNDYDIQHAINTAKKFFKNIKLKDINRKLYQQFINWYSEDHAVSTVKKVHIYCKECLRDALNDGLIDKDPTYKITPKGKRTEKEEELKYLNANEVEKLVIELKKQITPMYESRYILLIGLATGMRFSEIIGLAWKDIDFDNHTISIKRSYDHVITHDFVNTKTSSSMRTISIDDQTMQLLREYKLGNSIKHPEYLFIDNSGHAISNKACNNTLKRACRNTGIKEITCHALRHTHCSLLLYKGINIQYISKRLGHADVSTTYNIYSHIIDEMKESESAKTVDMMGKIMAK